MKTRYSRSTVATTTLPTTALVALLATSRSLVKAEPTPAFVLARVFAADGVCVAAFCPRSATPDAFGPRWWR
jgi:hypothetical protein